MARLEIPQPTTRTETGNRAGCAIDINHSREPIRPGDLRRAIAYTGAGIPGDTAAIISGSLSVNSQLQTDANGSVLVDATSAADAVAKAFVGIVSSQFDGGVYNYDIQSVSTGIGQTTNAAFTLNGEATVLKFEDLAASPNGSDWDYNDHSWAVSVEPVPIPAITTPATIWITVGQDAHEQNQQYGWFIVHRSNSAGSLTVNYSAPTGTASWGLDYTGPAANGGSVTFVEGETEKRIVVLPISDNDVESSETVSIELRVPSPYLRYLLETPNQPISLKIRDKNEVGLEVIDSAGKATAKLRVGRWEDAFKRDPGEGVKISVVADFIEKDPERFAVRATDSTANKLPNKVETISVTARVDSDKVPRELTLTETGINTGIFVSKSLLMTSIKSDDAHPVDGIANGAKDDRTFRILELGEKIAVTYGDQKSEAATTLEKVVKIHIHVIRDQKKADGGEASLFFNGEWLHDEATIGKSVIGFVSLASWIFAPIGIRFDVVDNKVNFADPPKGVDPSDGLTGWTVKDSKIVLSDEEKALFDEATLRTKGLDDIEVYFVSELKVADLLHTGGEALAPSYSPDKKYNDSVVIGKVGGSVQLLAHELGHILLDDGDHFDPDQGVNSTRLMSQTMISDGAVTDSRRFTAGQAKTIATKRKDLLSDSK